MRPAKCQKMAPFPTNGHKELGLDCRLSTSKAMYCEKCGFVSADPAAFRKHILDHTATRFYCFYCNHVSYSEAELQSHLEQHTTTYPHKCPYCGQDFIRKNNLINHIRCMHGGMIDQGLTKPVTVKIPQPSLSTVLHRSPNGESSSVTPRIQIKIPPPTTAPPARVDKDIQRSKTVDAKVSCAPKVEAELLSPLSEPIQHNRALTVSLPEEVTIPAGCLVELIELKTVNGTKELKLRLVSQQENEGVVKDDWNTVSQNAALGKTLSSALNSHPNTLKPGSMGMCTVNRKLCETKDLNAERPAVFLTAAPKSIPNPAGSGTLGTKRPLQKMISRNGEHPAVVPAKVAKQNMQGLANKGECGIKITLQEMSNMNAARPTVTQAKSGNQMVRITNPASNGLRVSSQTLCETKNPIQQHSTSVPTRNVSYPNSIQDLQMLVKNQSKVMHPMGGTPLDKETVLKNLYCHPNLQSVTSTSVSSASSVLTTGNVLVAPAVHPVCKSMATADKAPLAPNSRYSTLIDLLSPAQPKEERPRPVTDSKTSVWTHSGPGEYKPHEGNVSKSKVFPVISSVYSLSQQPQESQGCVPPLVIAVRRTSQGAASIKTLSNTAKPVGHRKVKGTSTSPEPQTTQQTSYSVEIAKADQLPQHPQTPAADPPVVKKEEKCVTAKHYEKCQKISTTKSLPPLDVPVAEALAVPSQSTADVPGVSSKFLTVCLKRVRVGLWKKDKKRRKMNKKLKSKAPQCTETRGGPVILPPTPLKVDQLVKQPGPNQPVVVLNHPRPKVLWRAAGENDTTAPEVLPKCQILKMRLSKVMGQKYEVVGVTVRVFS